MAANKPIILVVDDEPGIRLFLEIALTQAGAAVLTAATGAEAVALAQRHPDLQAVLVDVHLPGMDGPATWRALRAVRPGLRCAFLTGLGDPDLAESLRAQGAALVLFKPFTAMELVAAAGHLLAAEPAPP